MITLTKEKYIKTSKTKRPALLVKYNTTEEKVLGTEIAKTYVVIKEFPNGKIGDEITTTDNYEVLYPEYYKLKTTDKPKVHHVYLVDVSSSMNEKGKINTISEKLYKEMEQAAINTNAIFSVITFNSKIDVIVNRSFVPIYRYYMANGMTNLNGAIIEATKLINYNEHTLVKIFTDGDNNTGSYSLSFVKQELSKLPKNITVTFVCTSEDYFRAKNYVDESNIMVYDNTGKGLEKVLDTYAINTVTYSNNISRGMDVSKGFFKDIKK